MDYLHSQAKARKVLKGETLKSGDPHNKGRRLLKFVSGRLKKLTK